MDETPKRNRGKGFAAMDPERRRELARLGGQRAQESGAAHRFDSEEARAAGKKGGAAFAAKKRRETPPGVDSAG